MQKLRAPTHAPPSHPLGMNKDKNRVREENKRQDVHVFYKSTNKSQLLGPEATSRWRLCRNRVRVLEVTRCVVRKNKKNLPQILKIYRRSMHTFCYGVMNNNSTECINGLLELLTHNDNWIPPGCAFNDTVTVFLLISLHSVPARTAFIVKVYQHSVWLATWSP